MCNSGSLIFFALCCPCNRYLFLFSTYRLLSSSRTFSFPIFIYRILQNSCRLFCFVLFFFSFSSFLFSWSPFSWSGLFCCVFVPGTSSIQYEKYNNNVEHPIHPWMMAHGEASVTHCIQQLQLLIVVFRSYAHHINNQAWLFEYTTDRCTQQARVSCISGLQLW